MDVYEFVHLALYASGGEIKGKTKLQKTVYFLGVLTECIENLGYRAHFYGPYSEDVADALGRLRTVDFVDQNIVGGGAADPFGFERSRYDYRLNSDGDAMAEAKAEKHPDTWKKLEGAARRLNEAGELDYMRLSIAAKIHFMLRENQSALTKDQLARLATRFGWSVSLDQVSEAATYLQKLGLVKLANG